MLKILAGALVAATVASTSALAQQPIRLIVGTPAGGAIDAYARIIGDKIQAALNRTVLIENKVGAGGNIAARGIVETPADGTQIWVGTQAMTEINPSVYKNTGWKISDFQPLIKGVEAPLAFSTHPSVPAKTFAEFLAWAKANNGKLSYASYTPGTPKEILDPLMKAIAAAHQDPEVKAKLEAQGFDISGQSGEAFRAEIEKQTARWAELAKATNFSAD